MSFFVKYFLVGVVCCFLASCSSTKITRVDPKLPIDLSGSWNDYDAHLAANELIKDCLNQGWLDKFIIAMSRKPVLIVGHVANRSMEHINTQVITKDLEKELINSGRVIFVASPTEREDVRDERDDQHQGMTDPATIKEIGKERGADLMLIGSINSVVDEIKGKEAIFYQINLELIDITTNEKLWLGQKEIKKKVERSKYSL